MNHDSRDLSPFLLKVPVVEEIFNQLLAVQPKRKYTKRYSNLKLGFDTEANKEQNDSQPFNDNSEQFL